MFQNLRDILHNTEDHLAVLNDILLGNQAQGEAKDLLLKHIAREETANLEALNALFQSSPSYEVEVARDHSQLILDMISGVQITPNLSLKLLEHLLEEQRELLRQISASPRGAAPSRRQGWTVGSLIGK